MKMIRGLEHLFCEERLQVLVLFNLEKRKIWAELIVALQYLQESCRGTFNKGCIDRTRGNGFKLKEGKSKLDRRKNSLL